MKVVVTGGAGFIGANLCRVLAQAGHEVLAFDDLSTGAAANLDGVEAALVEGTILDPGALDAAFDGAGAVVHLAARPSVPRSIADPLASHEVNATGTMQVLEAVRRGSGAHVIVASSSSVYGANPGIPKSEDLVPIPMSPYAAVVPAFVDAALAGAPLPVFGDGRQTRDFTFVGTVTAVLANAVDRRLTSERPVNLAFGSRVSLLDVAALLGTILGRELELDFGPARVGDVRDSQADQTRLRSLFPDVEPTALEAGLRATVDWFRNR